MKPRIARVGDAIGGDAIPPELDAAIDRPEGVFSTSGVFAMDRRLLVVLPRNHPAPSDPLNAGLCLAAALFRYRRDPKKRSVEAGRSALDLHVSGSEEDAASKLEAAFLLHADHAALGPLTFSESRLSIDEPGRVHWPRTIRDGAPTEGPGGPAVLGHRTVRVRRAPQHPITLLHEAMARVVAGRLGVGPPASLPMSARDALPLLRESLRRSFGERRQRVLGLMLRILEGEGRAEQTGSTFSLIIRDFSMIWERMLQVVLGDVALRTPLTGLWHLPNGLTAGGARLLPDIVVPWGDHLMVLDAKDYAVDCWPATHDLEKQLLYRLLLSAPYRVDGPPQSKVGNGFLFPGGPDLVRPRGEHRLRGEAGSLGEVGRVVGLTVDLPTVMNGYLSGRAHAGLREAVAAEVLR